MSEVISQLSVQLAMDSGNFSKAITNANKAIKNLDREFKTATRGIESVEKSFVGLGTKIDTLNKKIEVNSQKLNAQKQSYSKLEDTLEKQKAKLSEIESELGKNSDAWTKQAELVTKNSAKLSTLATDINKTESEISQLTSELQQSESAFQQLGNKTETLDDKLDKIGQSANLAESQFNRLASELEQSGGYFAKLGNEMDQLSSKIDSGKAKINAYQSEISQIGSVLDKAKAEHQQLGQAINKTEQELEQAKAAYGANSSEVQQLRQKLLQLKDGYNSLESEIEQNESALKGYQAELNNTVADVNRLQRELNTMPFDRVGNDMKSMGQNIKGVGQDLMPVTAAITATGVAAGKMSYDFDQGLSKVGTLVQKSGSEMREYEDTIKELSRTTGVSLNDITEAMYQGISAGGDLGNIFTLLEYSSKLAVGGFTSNEVAIDGLTTAMNAFGISYDEVNSVADKFILTQNNGKTVVDELASSMGKVAPIANAAGVSLEEMLSATAALTMSGLATSEAMTALKAAFSNVIKPSSEAQKMAKDLGIEFNSTALESMGLAGFLDMLKEATGGNIDKMAKLFGSTEALNAILLLTGEGADVFTGTLEEMNNATGLANDSFENMKESAGSKLVDAFNSLKISMMEMGDTLAPIVEALAQGIQKVADWFSNLDENAQKNVVTFAMVVAAIAPLMVVLGNILIVGGNVVTLFGGLGVAGGGLATVLGGLSAVALPALGVALLGLATYIGGSETAILGLQEKFGGLGTVIGGVCEFISGVVQFTFGGITSHIQLAFDLMAAVIDGPGGATMEQAYEAHAQRLLNNSEESWDKMTLSTTRGMSQMRNASDEQLEGTVASMQTILNSVPSIVDGSYSAAAVMLGNQLATMDSTQITILKGMNDTTKAMFDGIREGMDVDEATAKVKSNLEGMAKSGKIDVETLEKDATAALQQMQKQMSESSKKGADDVNKNTKQAKQDASKNTQELAKEVDKNTKDAKTKADSNTKEAANAVKSNTDKMAQDAKTNTSKVATDTDADFKKANQSIQQESTNMYNGAKQSFTKLAEIAKQAGTDMYNGVSNSASKMASSAKSSASAMYNGVTSSTSKMASQAIADWNRVRSAYSTPIVGKINVTKTTTNVTKSVTEKANTMFNALSNDISTFNTPTSTISIETDVNEDAIKGLEEQLRKTNEVEKKITQIYQKEVEKRKKLIDDELKAKLDSLNKQKNAYNDYRAEANYKRDYEDQLDLVNELQKKLDIASKDTSLGGQKKYQELLKQLEQEQRKLEDIVQSKIDSDVNDLFDKQAEELTNQAESAKDELDKILDPKNLQNLVSEALKSGMFKDLEGNLHSLSDVMLEFEDTFGDGLSSIGALIKSELIENLNLAKDTIKDFTNILDKLGIGGFNSSEYAARMSTLDYSSSRYNNDTVVGKAIKGIRKGDIGKPVTVQFNQPLCVIQGNVDNSLMPQIEKMIKKAQEDVVRNIVKSIR